LFDDAIASQQLGLLDQECERELEEEAEEEVVVETECTTLEPRDEYQWDVQQVMQCGSSLPPCLRAVHLRELAHRLSIAPQLSALGLDDADVWVTQNFMFAIDGVSTEFDSFLRFPDVVLVFPSGKLLLISELEAESLFRCWMDGKWPSKLAATSSPMLVNWSTLRFADREQLPMVCGMRRWVVHDRELCAMHLFLGEPQLHESVENPERAAEPPRFDSMRTLLKTKGAGREELEHGVRALMRVRGTVSCYERSHLQYVIETCNEAESETSVHSLAEHLP